MFWSLRYNSISPLELSPWSSIEFDMDFGRWVKHKHRRSRLDVTTWRSLSRSLKVDLISISLFHFIFIFIFDLFSIFRTRIRVRVTKITLSHSRSHQMTQSQVTWRMEGCRRFWKDDVIQHVKYMLTLRHTHGRLG